MKKFIAIILCLAMAVALCGCCLKHEYAPATCTEPATCTKCGKTDAKQPALGHTWAEATCTEPKTCTVCGATEGEALGHDWAEATLAAPKTCTVCGATEGEPVGTEWVDAFSEELNTKSFTAKLTLDVYDMPAVLKFTQNISDETAEKKGMLAEVSWDNGTPVRYFAVPAEGKDEYTVYKEVNGAWQKTPSGIDDILGGFELGGLGSLADLFGSGSGSGDMLGGLGSLFGGDGSGDVLGGLGGMLGGLGGLFGGDASGDLLGGLFGMDDFSMEDTGSEEDWEEFLKALEEVDLDAPAEESAPVTERSVNAMCESLDSLFRSESFEKTPELTFRSSVSCDLGLATLKNVEIIPQDETVTVKGSLSLGDGFLALLGEFPVTAEISEIGTADISEIYAACVPETAAAAPAEPAAA